tara:strand:- start:812 stop:1399 length:588 start_codon:yes stop_codon:yes gene_type:complete
MAILYTYNTALPSADDLLLGTEKNATLRNPTKNFRLSDIAAFVITSFGGTNLRLPIFFNVTDGAGNVTTVLRDSIMSQDANPGGTTLTIAGNISVTGTLADSGGLVGTAGQVLSSTGTGTQWIAAAAGGAGTGVYPFTARTSFTITHNGAFGTNPSVSVVTTPNLVEVFGEVTYDSNTALTVKFSPAIAGVVYLN